MRVSVRWISGDEHNWVGEAHTYNISNSSAIRQAKLLDSTLRDIFQLYEGFYLFDHGKGEVRVLRSSHLELNQETSSLGIGEFISLFS
jgi:hypothetical protein